MKVKHFALTAVMTATVGLASSATSSAQAAVLGGTGSCANVTFTYINCAGYYIGNDKGAQGTGLNNLNSWFQGSPWTLVGEDESGAGLKEGTAGVPAFSGFGAFAVKAGNSYALYTVADLASFDWSTTGVARVGNQGRNIPGLSHLSFYKPTVPPTPEPESVPEPGLLLGLVAAAGIGSSLKRRADSVPM